MYKPPFQNNPQTRETINIPKSSSHLISTHPIPTNDINYVHNVEVKSGLTGTKPKTIEIQPNQNRFIVYSGHSDLQKGKTQQYPLNEITIQQKENEGRKNNLQIHTNTGKTYSFNTENPSLIADQINKGQTTYQINRHQFQQQPVMIPKQVNYLTPLNTNQFQRRLLPPNQIIFTQQYPLVPNLQHQHIEQHHQDLSHYPRRKFYLNPQDWSVNKKNGLILFVNEQKRQNQKKVITWVIKKFLSTGSFNGISYPTFVMKPESILESYAHAVGAAPWLFQNVTNPVQRMKKFICLIQSFSLLCCDTTKPFNPPLGETFQAKIANGLYYAEQIIHHPPVSAFFYEGKGYKLYGCLEMTASIGPNSAKGSFSGDLKVQFEDGMTYVGRIPCGEFSGFLIGEEKFQTYGTFYAYSNKKLVFSGNTANNKRNFFQGYIGKLKPQEEQQFFNLIQSPDRFSKFPFFQRHCFDTVFSFMQMNYPFDMNFDGREYFNTEDERYLPILPQEIQDKKILLKSDSRFRKDIPLRKLMRFQEAQVEKEKLEQQERYFRKMRNKYDPWNHPSS